MCYKTRLKLDFAVTLMTVHSCLWHNTADGQIHKCLHFKQIGGAAATDSAEKDWTHFCLGSQDLPTLFCT